MHSSPAAPARGRRQPSFQNNDLASSNSANCQQDLASLRQTGRFVIAIA
jgi:hypothetical protein